MQQEYITELRVADVLLGRGSGPNDHEGNIRFRQRVAERKSAYMATNHRLTKAKIAQDIVDSVYAENGRFLRKLEADELEKYGVPDGVDAWFIATEDVIMEKAKQALRQNTAKNKGFESQQALAKAQARLSPVPPLTKSQIVLNPPYPSQHQYQEQQQRQHPQVAPETQLDDFEPIPLTAASSDYGRTSHQPSVVTSSSHHQHHHQQHPVQSVNRISPTTPSSIQQLHQQQQQHQPQLQQQSQPQPQWVNSRVVGVSGAGSGEGPRYTGSSGVQQQSRLQHPQHPSVQFPEEEDSILAHLPESVRMKYARSTSGGNKNNNNKTVGTPHHQQQQSLENIPDDIPGTFDDDDDEYQNRRGSMTMGELERVHAKRRDRSASDEDMAGLLDSYSRMSVAEQKKMMASTETMGTIEPIGADSVVENMVDMSLMMSMDGPVFSFSKGFPAPEHFNLSSGGGKPAAAGGGDQGSSAVLVPLTSMSSQGISGTYPMDPPENVTRNFSMSSQQTSSLPSSSISSSNNRQQSSSSSSGGTRPTPGNLSRENENKGLGLDGEPKPLKTSPSLSMAAVGSSDLSFNYDMMGQSSLSVLRAAFDSTDNIDIQHLQNPNHQQEPNGINNNDNNDNSNSGNNNNNNNSNNHGTTSG